MKWSPFLKYFGKSLVLIGLLLSVCQSPSLKACSISYPSDYFQVFFLESDLLDNQEYQEFYYPWYYNYRDAWQYQNTNSRTPVQQDFDSANIAEWKDYFGDKYSEEALREAIYTAEKSVFESLSSSSPGLPDSLSGNTLLKSFKAGKNTLELEYLLFAKECEAFASLDRWYDTADREPTTMRAQIERGKELRENCTVPFLRDRYAFQIVRLYHYLGKYQEAIDTYNALFPEGKTGSPLIRYRAMLLKAGALKWEKKTGESQYLFGKVFHECPPLRKSADHDFSFFSPLDFPDALAYAENEEEQATLWAMRGFHSDYPDLETLRNLSDFDVDETLLEVLLVRQLNLLEAEIMSPRFTQNVALDESKVEKHQYRYPQVGDLDFDPGQIEGYESKRGFWASIGDFFRAIAQWFKNLFSVADPQNPFYDPDDFRDEEIAEDALNRDNLLQDYVEFTQTKARTQGTAHPELWYLASGYVEFMRGQYAIAEGLYKNAEKTAPQGSNIHSQIQLLRSLTRIMEAEKIDAKEEKELLVGLQWLEQMKATHQNNRIMDRTLTVLGQRYLAQDELLKGIMCFAKLDNDLPFNVLCDVYAEEDDLKALRSTLESGGTNAWEKWLLKDFPLEPYQLQDLIGTRYLRMAKFEEAYKEFKSLPESYWTERKEDPAWREYAWVETTDEVPEWAYFEEYKLFFASFDPGGEVAEEEGLSGEFSKLSFLEKVIDLEQQARDHPDEAYDNYLKIAHGFESTPFWGYSGTLWKGNLTWQWQFYYSANQYPFNIPEFSTELYIREHQFLIEYGSYKLAQLFYRKAMDATEDPELGAEACFAALSCENHFQTSIHRSHDWQADISLYELFRDRYGSTSMYKFAEENCPTMNAYLNRAVN